MDNAIKLDTCLNNDGKYEICVYQDISNLDMAERVETLRKFKNKGVKMLETTSETMILDLLRGFNLKLGKSTDKSINLFLNRLKSQYGKTIKVEPYKNKDKNISVVGVSEQGHDICLSQDNRLYMVVSVCLQ